MNVAGAEPGLRGQAGEAAAFAIRILMETARAGGRKRGQGLALGAELGKENSQGAEGGLGFQVLSV